VAVKETTNINGVEMITTGENIFETFLYLSVSICAEYKSSNI